MNLMLSLFNNIGSNASNEYRSANSSIISTLLNDLDLRISSQTSTLPELFHISRSLFDKINELGGNPELVADRVHTFVTKHWNDSSKPLQNLLESWNDFESFEVFENAHCTLIPEVGFAHGQTFISMPIF